MFWSKARKIKELESNLDAMENLIGSIKIQRDSAHSEERASIDRVNNLAQENGKIKNELAALAAERDQLHQKVGELEKTIEDLTKNNQGLVNELVEARQ